MPKLILKFEAAVIKEVPMTATLLTIGRKPDNDLVIDHPAVSGHHCRISLQGDTYFVEDLNSTNGTLVNDKKIIKAGVHHNDVIGIAKHTLVFLDERPAGSTAPPAAAPSAAPAAPPAPAPASGKAAPAGSSLPEFIPAAKPAAAPDPNATGALKKFDRAAGLRVIDGVVDQVEYTLADNSTYIGKSERANIPIKGFMAPEVAAMISRKTDGFVLVAIKEGYPKVNGMPVEKERPLNEGDVLEIGGTKMQFFLKTP